MGWGQWASQGCLQLDFQDICRDPAAMLRQQLSEYESGFKYLRVLRTGEDIRHSCCVLRPTVLLALGG